MKNIEKDLLNAVYFVGQICLYVFLSILFINFIEKLNIEDSTLLNIDLIFADVLIMSILIFINRKDMKKDLKNIRTKKGSEKIVESIKIWLVGCALMIISNTFINIIVGSMATNEAANEALLIDKFSYSIISMILLAPICEEILFRYLPRKFINNNIIYILFSGVLFGFAHVFTTNGSQLLYIIPYAILGIAFARIYQKYNNIFCSITTHVLHNLLCILLIVL